MLALIICEANVQNPDEREPSGGALISQSDLVGVTHADVSLVLPGDVAVDRVDVFRAD